MINDDQSINQSINRSINQSINWSINQSINRSINQSMMIDQSINQSIDQKCSIVRYHRKVVSNRKFVARCTTQFVLTIWKNNFRRFFSPDSIWNPKKKILTNFLLEMTFFSQSEWSLPYAFPVSASLEKLPRPSTLPCSKHSWPWWVVFLWHFL